MHDHPIMLNYCTVQVLSRAIMNRCNNLSLRVHVSGIGFTALDNACIIVCGSLSVLFLFSSCTKHLGFTIIVTLIVPKYYFYCVLTLNL